MTDEEKYARELVAAQRGRCCMCRFGRKDDGLCVVTGTAHETECSCQQPKPPAA